MDPIFCHLNAVSGAFGAEMKQLLDVALTVEQHQPDGSLQYQDAFEASAGAVTPVAVGLHLVAGFLRQLGEQMTIDFLKSSDI